MPADRDNSEGYETLQKILAEAVANGADAVELEYDSGGSLEVMFMSGNRGGGYMLDKKLGREVTSSLWDEKQKSRGKFRITLDGKDYMVQVKTYDSFGETAFRLTFHEARRKKQGS